MAALYNSHTNTLICQFYQKNKQQNTDKLKRKEKLSLSFYPADFGTLFLSLPDRRLLCSAQERDYRVLSFGMYLSV